MERALAALANALFPRFCVACRREGALLCRACDEAWHPQATLPLSEGELEGERIVTSLLRYADPIARQLLTAWKYQYDMTAWETLRRKMAPELPQLHLRSSVRGMQAIVPVPLSTKRRCERGFDQAEAIADWLSSGIHLPVARLLKRKLTFGHQADRSITERTEAMARSPFVASLPLSEGELVGEYPTRILLVDDVWTTGATMRAAAAPLINAGYTVHFFTLAKGS